MDQFKEMNDRLLSLSVGEYGDSQHSIYDLVVDFGTTFTKAGALRVFPPHPRTSRKSVLDDIVIIDRYPGPHSSKHLTVEAPTTWVYSGHNLVAWGMDLNDREENDEVTIELVKLLLDESELGATVKEKIKEKLRLVQLSVVDVLTDYFRSLFRHCVRRIDNIDPNGKLFRVILCIPAIWQALAQKTMREACEKALCAGMVLRGQTDHGLITEPEAITAFLMEKYPELDVEAGDLIEVLDCGGGTSDIALLEIVQRKPLHMNQAAPVDGAMLGSIVLDEAFEQLLRQRLRHVAHLPRSKMESGFRKAVGEFRYHLKPTFELGNSNTYSFWFEGLRNDPDNRTTHNRVWVTEAELREVFDPVARGNVDLGVRCYERYRKIMEREKTPVKKVKYLFFVGGLSGSVYMEKAIRTSFTDDHILGHRVPVRTPSDKGATAIVQGALLLSSNISIMKDVRIPHGYAIIRDEPWRRHIHGGQVKKTKDKHTNCLMVKDRVKVLVQKEDIIQDSHRNCTSARSGELHYDWDLGQPCDVEVNLWRLSERVEDHAGLAELRSAGVISLVYTLRFNLEDAVDARTEWYRIGGERGIRQVNEPADEQANGVQPRITRRVTRSQATEVGLVDGTNAVQSTPPRSPTNFHDQTDLDGSSPDTMEGANRSLNSSQSSNTINQNRETFFRSTFEVVVRIVGSELTFKVEALPGGPISQAPTLDIADIGEEN